MMSIVWQDFYLITSVGKIGSTPLFVLMPFLVCFEFYLMGTKKNWLKIGGDIALFFVTLLVLYLIISFFYILFFTLKGELNFLGENIIVKTIKQSFYYLFLILLVRNLDYVLNRINSKETISDIAYYVLLIVFIILIGEIYQLNKTWVWPNKPNAWSGLHSNLRDVYWRVRLLTPEASFTGPIVVVFSVLSLLFTKSKWRYVIVTSFFLLYFFNTGSKGFLMSFLLALLLMILLKVKTRYIFGGGVLLLLGFALFVYPFLTPQNLKLYSSSLMTRFTGFFAGLYSVALHPFGTGGLNYIFTLDVLKDVTSFSKALLGNYANTAEIDRLIASGGDKNLGIKSTIGHWGVTFGIFGIALYYYLCYKLIKYNKDNRLLYFASLFFIFTTMFVLPLEMEYPSVLLLVVSQYLYFRRKEELLNEY